MTAPLHIETIAHDSDAWRAAVALRHAVLRAPLGLQFSATELAAEHAAYHYGAYACVDAGVPALVATAFLVPLDAECLQLRQMAVAPGRHRQGVGRALLLHMERAATAQGFRCIVAQARSDALPFYLALGYAADGAANMYLGIPHRPIRKTLGR